MELTATTPQEREATRQQILDLTWPQARAAVDQALKILPIGLLPLLRGCISEWIAEKSDGFQLQELEIKDWQATTTFCKEDLLDTRRADFFLKVQPLHGPSVV